VIAGQTHYEVLGVSQDASQEEIDHAFYKDKVKEHPPEQDEEGHKRIREAYDVLSNPDARAEYDALLRSGGEIEELREEAERLLNQEDGDVGTAIKKLKKAVVLSPEIGVLRSKLGNAYLQNGQPREALEQFNEAIDLDQETAPSHRLNRGHALRELDRHREAERAYRDVWEKDKGFYAAARGLASCLFEQDRVEEAHDVLDKAIWADDKLDFEDFFCYYDKLQLYVTEGETEVLEDELETVKDLPETDDDRKYAAFMLAQTGQMLADGNVYGLAQKFVDTAVELDPNNPQLLVVQEFVQENARIEESFEEIANSPSIHDFVKHMVGTFYQAYLGVIDEQDFQNQIDEINAGLGNVMRVDPDNTEIKESVRHIREQYPEVFQLNEGAFEAVLSMSDASLKVDDCPHCGDHIQFEKGTSGRGTCSGCSGPVKISGGTVKDPSTTTRTSTSRTRRTKTSGSTSASNSSSSRSKDRSSSGGEPSTQKSQESSDTELFDYIFWGAVILGFIIPPHVWGFFILLIGVFIYSVKD